MRDIQELSLRTTANFKFSDQKSSEIIKTARNVAPRSRARSDVMRVTPVSALTGIYALTEWNLGADWQVSAGDICRRSSPASYFCFSAPGAPRILDCIPEAAQRRAAFRDGNANVNGTLAATSPKYKYHRTRNWRGRRLLNTCARHPAHWYVNCALLLGNLPAGVFLLPRARAFSARHHARLVIKY